MNLRCLCIDADTSQLLGIFDEVSKRCRMSGYFTSRDYRLRRSVYLITSLIEVRGQWTFKLRKKTIDIDQRSGDQVPLQIFDLFELPKRDYVALKPEPKDP